MRKPNRSWWNTLNDLAHGRRGRRRPRAGLNWRSPRMEPLEKRHLLSVTIIDDGDDEFSIEGDWTPYQGPGLGYNDDGYYSWKGTGADVATWSFTVTAGKYKVAATWLHSANRAIDAPYRVYDDTTELSTVRVDQTAAPDDFFDFGQVRAVSDVSRLGGNLLVGLSF